MFIKEIFLLFLLIGTSPASAELYKCTVADRATYQDKPCQTAQKQAVIPQDSATTAAASALPSVNASPVVERDAKGKIKRSEKAKSDFKAAHPCPVNGHRSGACPGYVIDHITPLACGGEDSPLNMQWQTVAEGKEKDSWERDDCQPITKNHPPLSAPVSSTAENTKPIVYIGARGGRYVITKTGRKRYLKHKAR